MGWLANRMMRRATDRALERFSAEVGPGPRAKTLALAIGHACYPNAVYGDNGDMDDMVSRLSSFPIPPCESETALSLVKQWESGSLTADEAFGRIWGLDPDTFVVRLIKKANR